MELITKYSDYAIQSIEYFITTLESELEIRDIKGLTNDKIEIINVSKQHPLVTLMAAQLSDNRNADSLRSGIIPAISVTPGSLTDEGFTLGQGFRMEVVDSEYETILKSLLNMSDKEIQTELLITKTQIESILSVYRKKTSETVRAQIHEWRKNEEINVSAWSDTPDVDLLLGNLLESIFAEIQVGFVGDESKIQNFKYKPTKGLTNFNFGRVLFGTEFNLTFMNTYNNYTIYTDTVISGHDFNGDFEIPGSN